jgi:lipase maturation factor 1
VVTGRLRELVRRDPAPPSLRLTRWLFLRLLGVSALCAFVSLWVQMDGLFLSGGIAPAADAMDAVRAHADAEGWSALGGFLRVPTLAWLSAGDGWLTALAAIGTVAALLLIADVAPGPMIAVLWLTYLSLVQVGDVFFGFQWDALLIETLFAALFLAPWRLRPRLRSDREPPAAGVWLLRLLLFKLMLLSGLVKLIASDGTWIHFEALDVHFFTQPLPTWTAWWAHHAPHWLHVAMLLVVFAVELVLPFLVFAPRRLRIAFGAGTMFLMLAIGATGNYGFFNLLTFAIAVMCLDDRALARLVPGRLRVRTPDPQAPGERIARPWVRRTLWSAAALLLVIGALQANRRLRRGSDLGAAILRRTAPFESVNAYGLFQDMTLRRPEIVLEGSRDGATWQAYEFRWKPGDLARRPAFTGPHMPRLDWQMWFAALYGCRGAPWFVALEARLLEGRPEVRELFARDPFGDDPPRYLRSTLYEYRFTEPGEDGWWTRRALRPFCPPVARARGVGRERDSASRVGGTTHPEPEDN